MKTFAIQASGATAIEYGLIAALIAVVILASLQTLGGQMATMYSSIAGSMP